MTRYIFTILILFIGLTAKSQTEMTQDNVVKQSDGSLEFMLTDGLLKLNASQIDLFTFKVSYDGDDQQTLPEIIMPTSHANEYALLDFTNCENGVYWITGKHDDNERKFKILLKK